MPLFFGPPHLPFRALLISLQERFWDEYGYENPCWKIVLESARERQSWKSPVESKSQLKPRFFPYPQRIPKNSTSLFCKCQSDKLDSEPRIWGRQPDSPRASPDAAGAADQHPRQRIFRYLPGKSRAMHRLLQCQLLILGPGEGYRWMNKWKWQLYLLDSLFINSTLVES